MSLRVAAACLALASASAASAQEAISTAAASPPPPAAEAAEAAPLPQDHSAQEIADWARRVLAGAPSLEAKSPARPRCEAPPDRKPHGEVWAGIGTGGYREVGGVVTQPIGDCGSVTVAVSHTESNYKPRHRRR